MQYEHEIIDGDVNDEELHENGSSSALPDQDDTKKGTHRRAFLFLCDIVIAAGVLFLILQFFNPTIVSENSMANTLHTEDYVIVAKQAYVIGKIDIGDIIVYRSNPVDEHGEYTSLIKRVIGLPGDIISLRDGYVYRNGQRLYEPYTNGGAVVGEMAPIKVPAGSYFVMGDNRQIDTGSRNELVGFVTEEKITGKVFYRLLPASMAGRIF